MAGKFSPYLEYAENAYFSTSLPSHWSAKNLSYLAKQEQNAFVDGPFGSDLKSSEYLEVGVPLIQLNNIRDGHHVFRNMKFVSPKKANQLSRHIARPNEIVFAKMAEPVARSTLVSSAYSEYVIVADCVKMIPDPSIVDIQYLVWAINSDPVKIRAELVSTGTTRIRINLGELKKLKVPFPPLPVQTKIAAFLDYETAKIDGLIAKQQRLIALLEEKRQAVISHAVTKGLDPTAPLRPSGIDWLGDVPAHWEVKRLKFLALDSAAGPYGSSLTKAMYTLSGIKVYGQQQVISNDLTQGDYYISEEKFRYMQRYEVQPGEILISVMGTIGRVAVVPETVERGIINPRLVKYQLDHELVMPEFIRQTLLSDALQSKMRLEAQGSTMDGLNMNILGALPCAFPSIPEQGEIIWEVARKSLKFRKLLSNAQSAITLLKERRTALISAAVTGKIDLGDWQAPEVASDILPPDIDQNEEALA
jgi:type I restriction enzyme S subunit